MFFFVLLTENGEETHSVYYLVLNILNVSHVRRLCFLSVLSIFEKKNFI